MRRLGEGLDAAHARFDRIGLMDIIRGKQVVGVIWNDAHYNTDEADTSDITHRPWQYLTVGILVRSDATGVTVSGDIGEDGKWRGRNFIPRAMIVAEYPIGGAAPRISSRRRSRPAARPSVPAPASAPATPPSGEPPA